MTRQFDLHRLGILRRLFSSSSGHDSQPVGSKSSSMASNFQLAQAAMLSGPEKLAAVINLVERLTQDLDSANLLPNQRDAALEELKIYGRDPRDADPIFLKEGIEMLTRHAFDSPSSTTSRNALRCLCNALLLKKECRQTFVDLGYESKVCNKLKNDSFDDEFLVSRIIFLTTYDTDTKLEQLIDDYHLADSVIKNLERHAKHHNDARSTADPMQDMALTETLKLLFNITHHCKQKTSSFTQAVPHIVTILCKGSFQVDKPLDPPIGPLVNALLNLDLNAKEVQPSLYPPANPTTLPDRLINLLDKSRARYQDEELDSAVTPLLGVIQAVHSNASRDVQISIRGRLLPTDADRREILGRGSSLPSWLLKNSTNPIAPRFRDMVSELLFDLSDKDASKFVENVGYGFASGFLYNKNISIPQNAAEAFSSDTDSSSRPINPVTGQFLDSERFPDTPEMTEAEREREAERLFVLFQRLQANGVISVENPVRTAVEEGRFEELPDDYKEDVD
ncbi:guanine nucleotide exchange factor [Xylaria sp. FL1777]|nr:guanine nucleotide exchange factor [Xylaria sp. FL1777]